MIEQIADPADDKLERADREQAGVDHDPHRGFAQISRRARRLDDRRHPREPGRGELFEHAPDGEIIGVDVDRAAGHRGEDVLADEGAALRQRFDRAVEQDMRVGKLAAAFEEKSSACRRRPRCRSTLPAGRAGEVFDLVQLPCARMATPGP